MSHCKGLYAVHVQKYIISMCRLLGKTMNYEDHHLVLKNGVRWGDISASRDPLDRPASPAASSLGEREGDHDYDPLHFSLANSVIGWSNGGGGGGEGGVWMESAPRPLPSGPVVRDLLSMPPPSGLSPWQVAQVRRQSLPEEAVSSDVLAIKEDEEEKEDEEGGPDGAW